MNGLAMTGRWRARRRDSSPEGKHRASEGTIPADKANPNSPPRPPWEFSEGLPPPLPGLASWQASRIGGFLAAEYHSGSARNGRDLARYLREDAPWCSDTGLAVVLLVWLDFAAQLSETPWEPDVMLRALREAAELAVLELTAAVRPPGG
jgi:hypothetical protein